MIRSRRLPDGRFFIVAIVVLATATIGRSDDTSLFDSKVAPILVDRCLSCHSSAEKKGGLDLTRRDGLLTGGKNGPAVIAGNAEESLLFGRVADGEMPPKHPLDPAQIETLRSWIASGANYEGGTLQPKRAGADWWSVQAVKRPALPKVARRDWARTPVDLFILDTQQANGLSPSPEVDRLTFIRRVTDDLIGLPATPEEVRDFVEDRSPDAYERLVDRLLDSPHYGERWGRHWLDVVRFAESHGYETNNLRPNAWPYRDYVIRAMNRDTPFPQFVMEQLAGDTIADRDWLTEAATGFLVGGTHDVVGNQSPEGQLQQRVDDLDDLITATGTAFLGLTVNCARCHDHKFDPISQKDYYGLQAVFSGVNHAARDIPAPDADERLRQSESIRQELASLLKHRDELVPLARPDLGAVGRPSVDFRRNVERITPTLARAIRFTVLATNNGIEPCIDELEVWTAGSDSRNAALKDNGGVPSASSTYPNSAIHRLEHINDGRYGNSRSWISAAPGKGWVQVDWPDPVMIDRIVWGRDRDAAFADRLATEYVIEAAVQPGEWRVVASSADRAPFGSPAPLPRNTVAAEVDGRIKTLESKLAELSPLMKVYAGSFSPAPETFVLRRGDPMQKQEKAAPSVLSNIAPAFEMTEAMPESARRAALARWIGDPGNPLAPRVMVNRLWHYHFGQGIVSTPSDFGFNGGRPSHPALLDWLAAEFLDEGGRLKPIHRLIVLSATYRQIGRARPEGMERDAANRLLWRIPPRRREAEAIRDAMLSTCGLLDPRMGGEGYSIWEPNTNYVVVFTPKAELGPDTFRRMVYQFKPRSQADATFGAFDCPDGALVTPRRNTSTTALQALNLLHSRFVLQCCDAMAARLKTEAGADPAEQTALAFRLVFNRPPTDAERAGGAALLRDHGAAALARALFNSNEFLFIP
jgi:hypothetical protein